MGTSPWRKATTHVKAAGILGRGATQQAFDDSTSDSRVSPPTGEPVPFPRSTPNGPGENASYFNGHPQAPLPWGYSQHNPFAQYQNFQVLQQIPDASQPQMNQYGHPVMHQQPFVVQQPPNTNQSYPANQQSFIVQQAPINHQPLLTQQISILGPTYTQGSTASFGPSSQQYNAQIQSQHYQPATPMPINSSLQEPGCDDLSPESLLPAANSNRSYSVDCPSPSSPPRSYTAPSLSSRNISSCEHDFRSFDVYVQHDR